MKHVGLPLCLCAALCGALSAVAGEEPSRSEPATTNVRAPPTPASTALARPAAREGLRCRKVRVNFWSGPKADMAKQPTVLDLHDAPAGSRLHYYVSASTGRRRRSRQPRLLRREPLGARSKFRKRRDLLFDPGRAPRPGS